MGAKLPHLSPLSLVLGGAASGKSAFAERLVVARGGARIYLATAQALDEEMRARIERHRVTRGAGWRTLEAPLDLAPALGTAAPSDTVLIDCATLWLSNLLLAGRDASAQTAHLLTALAACPAPVVIVSNETGQGIVPENALARRFREAQGRLNQALAREAGLVVTVIAGLPMVLKGALPEGAR